MSNITEKLAIALGELLQSVDPSPTNCTVQKAKAVLEEYNNRAYVVAGPTVDEEKLYWSNEFGWAGRESATVFYDEDMYDPIESTGREKVNAV